MTTVTFGGHSSGEQDGLKSRSKLAKSGGRRMRRPVSDMGFSARRHQHPWESRKALSEDYEQPVSGREGWWRAQIRETPKPGSYDYPTFIEEMKTRPATYRFRSEGRRVDPQPHGKGALLLPGAYNSADFLDNLDKTPTPATYCFKGANRNAFDVLNFGKKDKEINICPTAYTVENYLALRADKAPSKHAGFKSQTQRFPTIYFVPKEGPAPGNYNYLPPVSPHTVSSAFRSKTPRFTTSHTKVPGPGWYEKTFQSPAPETIAKMGRQYGLFFSSAFQT